MPDLDTLEKISTIIVAIVNIILVLFVFLQIRDSRKPFVTTGLISREKIRKIIASQNDDGYFFKIQESKIFWEDICAREHGQLALFIRNDSKNVVNTIDFTFKTAIGNDSYTYKEKRLSHLNPKEVSYVFLHLDQLVKRFPQYFTECDISDSPEEKWLITIPKKDLSIQLTVYISYNPAIWILFPIKIEDNYSISWRTFSEEELCTKTPSELSDANPRIISENIRNDTYPIHKMQIREVV
jgi:hypothetical protein